MACSVILTFTANFNNWVDLVFTSCCFAYHVLFHMHLLSLFYLFNFKGIAGEYREGQNQATHKAKTSHWILNWKLYPIINLFEDGDNNAPMAIFFWELGFLNLLLLSLEWLLHNFFKPQFYSIVVFSGRRIWNCWTCIF